MNERFEKIYEIAEREGWTVSHEFNSIMEVEFTFSKKSPAGQDFSFTIDVEDDDEEDYVFAELRVAVYRYWEDLDVSEETYIWLNSQGHGVNGAPWDMKDLYEDMEACETMIHDLWLALEGIEKPTEEKPKQYVYEVFQSDAWHTTYNIAHRGCYLTLEDAVDAIITNGYFDEEEDLDYVRKHLLEYRQTPDTGDINYEISAIEVGEWDK
ncbi:MAG: hypothetical protein KBT34_03230 [Prevotella sp.]|nr:hypothetical protein [Candidatus Prevotella equi]